MSGAVVTLTLSPALDLSTSTPTVAPTHKLRCEAAAEQPGGGGVNVARVASRLGADTIAVLPLGGSTGARLGELLAAEDINAVHVPVAHNSRESFSVTESNTGDQYRFVVAAPPISDAELDTVLAATRDAAAGGASCVVVSGQTPPGVDPNVFGRIVDMVAPVPVIIDTSGPALTGALESGAVLVKPSARELSSIVGNDLVTEVDVLDAVRTVHGQCKVGTLVASIGSGGAFAVAPDRSTHRFRSPSVRVVSAIGAGDSMVAGIAVALSRGLDLHDALSLGIAAGAATVLTAGTDLCQPSDVDRLMPLVGVEPVE